MQEWGKGWVSQEWWCYPQGVQADLLKLQGGG